MGNALTYIYIPQCRFNDHIACSLQRLQVAATSVVRVMEMANIALRAGIESTSLAFWASVLTITLMSPLYPHLSIYAAPCPRGQCRQYY